ncbi:hypothetical protein GGU11DRAFT_750566 [Lentinula aff. detonsa]|nr:hypothetical protein GGU11DRAFT_750566 [Lentinula aff. detonsa]
MSDTESVIADTSAGTPAWPGLRPPVAFNIQTFPNVKVDWTSQTFFIRDGDTNAEYIASVDELIKLIHTSGAIAKKWSMPGGVPTKYIGVIGALWAHLPANSNAYFSYKDEDDNVSRSKTLIRYEHIFTQEQIDELMRKGLITSDLIADMGCTFPKPGPVREKTEGTDLDGVGGLMQMYSNTRVRQTVFIHGLVIATDKAQYHMAKQQAGKEERAKKQAAKLKPYGGNGKKDTNDTSTTISLRKKMDMWAVRNNLNQGKCNEEDDNQGGNSYNMQI